MNIVLGVMIGITLFTTLGSLITRAIYILKNQRADTGLYVGTYVSLLWFPLHLIGERFYSFKDMGAAINRLLPFLEAIGDSFISLYNSDKLLAQLANVILYPFPIILLILFWLGMYVFLPEDTESKHRTVIPFYYDVEVLKILSQVFFGVLFVGGIVLLWVSLITNLENSQIALDFNVYKRNFPSGLSEGIPFDTRWSWVGNLEHSPLVYLLWVILGLYAAWRVYSYAIRQYDENIAMIATIAMTILVVGLYFWIIPEFDKFIEPYLQPTKVTRGLISGFVNTLRVVLISVVAATILGILVGIGLLSNNFLIRKTSTIYTEIFRNTPLLVQLIFIYEAYLIVMPEETIVGKSNAITTPDSILGFELHEKVFAFSAQNMRFAKPVATDTAIWFYLAVFIGLVVAFLIRRWRLILQEQTGQPARVGLYAGGTLVFFVVAGWFVAGGYPLSGGPFQVEYPWFNDTNLVRKYEDGQVITPAFTALFFALTLYTASFIADIVKAGIQSVSKGQTEAAQSLGLKQSQVLSMIILPQALRLIIPPLGNQYVNVGKNSSLGLAVGFTDAYNAVQIANNESGQSVPFFFGLMVIYLSLSLAFSLLTNLMNMTTQLRTR